jgi:heptosyltransferase-2
VHFVLTRFSSLGDVVIQTAFANCLKINYPNCYITFVTLKPFAGLLEGQVSIDKVVGYEKHKNDFKSLKKLRTEIDSTKKIDFIIDLHGTTRSFIFKFMSSDIPCLNLDKRRLERFIFIKTKFNLLKKTDSHQVRLQNDLKSLLNLSAPTSLASFTVEDSTVNDIIIAPIASFAPKRWPIKNFKSLVKLILDSESFKDYRVVIVAGPDDDYVDELNELSIYNDRFLNMKGKTTLIESAGLIQKAKIVIGNDTGMGHIAESYNVPSLAIFGPTHEDLGFAPYLNNSASISKDIWCRPCSGTGSKNCFRKKQYCMELIEPSEVYSKILEMIG